LQVRPLSDPNVPMRQVLKLESYASPASLAEAEWCTSAFALVSVGGAALPLDWMSVSRPHAPASIAHHDAPLIGDERAKRNRVRRRERRCEECVIRSHSRLAKRIDRWEPCRGAHSTERAAHAEIRHTEPKNPPLSDRILKPALPESTG
jgi:hypothetical protein